MLIVPYQRAYHDQLMEIFQLNTPDYFAPEEQGDFEAFLSKEDNTYYVIKAQDTIAGGGGYIIDDITGRLVWNMIHPDQRGESLGITLVNYLLDQMRLDHRVHKIEVSTSQHAYQFYAKFGFQVREHKKDFRSTGLDLYKMEKPL